LLVGGATSERLLVDRVLGGLLDERIALAVLPVGIFVLVVGFTDIGSLIYSPFVIIPTITFSLRVEHALIVVPVNRSQVHLITVDDLGFLFEVKSLFVALNVCALNLAVILLRIC